MPNMSFTNNLILLQSYTNRRLNILYLNIYSSIAIAIILDVALRTNYSILSA